MKRNASGFYTPPMKRNKCFSLSASAKRHAPPMYPAAKRTCLRPEPPPAPPAPPAPPTFVQQLLQYIQSLEARIAALEQRRSGPAEPFSHQTGIVVF